LEYNPKLRRFDFPKGQKNIDAGSYLVKINIWDQYGKVTKFELKIIISSPEEQISIITEGDEAKLPQGLSMNEIKRYISSEREYVIQKRIETHEGPMLPEVRVTSVSPDGKVSLTFTKDMIVPANFTDLLNVRNGTEVYTVISKVRVQAKHFEDPRWYINEVVEPDVLLQLVMLR